GSAGRAAVVVVPDDVLERLVVAVVHVRRGQGDVAQAGRAPGALEAVVDLDAVAARVRRLIAPLGVAREAGGGEARRGRGRLRHAVLDQLLPAGPRAGRQAAAGLGPGRAVAARRPVRAIVRRRDVIAGLGNADVVEVTVGQQVAVVAIDARR